MRERHPSNLGERPNVFDIIKVMTSGGFTVALLEVIPEFERATGHTVVTARCLRYLKKKEVRSWRCCQRSTVSTPSRPRDTAAG